LLTTILITGKTHVHFKTNFTAMKKFKTDWRACSLENLENEVWEKPAEASHLIRRCHELRKIPLGQFATEDLRIMIGQQNSLDFLIPLALETLTGNLFAEGDFFPGDLLKTLLELPTTFWNDNKAYWQALNNLIKDKRQFIKEHKFNTTNFDSCKSA
jgi:hypothetical protein